MDFNSVNAQLLCNDIQKMRDHSVYLLERAKALCEYEEKMCAEAQKDDNEVIKELKEKVRNLERELITVKHSGLTEEEINFFNDQMKGKYQIKITHTGIGPVKKFQDLREQRDFTIRDLT